jgi:predicted RNA-binding protein with PIN domain
VGFMAKSKAIALLLVDGYNVIGAWPDLSQVRDQVGLEPARHRLTETLVNYAAYNAFEVKLVFDAYAQRTPTTVEAVTQHLAIHYTAFGQTADSYIEAWCARLRHHPQRTIVVTSDRAQQLTVVGYGAEWMSTQQLSVDITTSVQRHCKHRHRAKSHRGASQRFLANGLSTDARERLQRLRFGKG